MTLHLQNKDQNWRQRSIDDSTTAHNLRITNALCKKSLLLQIFMATKKQMLKIFSIKITVRYNKSHSTISLKDLAKYLIDYCLQITANRYAHKYDINNHNE